MIEPLSRITDITEIMPPIDRARVQKLIIDFREHCLTRFDDFAPPGFAKDDVDERFGVPPASTGQAVRIREAVLASTGYRRTAYEAIECLTELLQTPRSIKRVLGSTGGAWEHLHGEIYFDDLLVVLAIRETAHSLFDLLAYRIREFRLYDGHPREEGHLPDLPSQVEAVLGSTNPKPLYHKLLRFMFPGWPLDGTRSSSLSTPKVHPQGIAVSDGGVDYFVRLTAEEVPENETSDQRTMRELLRINDEQEYATQLADLMVQDDLLSERVEYFGQVLKPSRVLSITAAFFEIVRENQWYSKFDDALLTGRLWRMALDNPDTEDNYRLWFRKQVERHCQSSLRFANSIDYFWRHRTRDYINTDENEPEMRRLSVERVRFFLDKPAEFACILRGDLPFIWVLRHVVYDYKDNETVRKQTSHEPFREWKPWLAKLLADASRSDAQAVAVVSIPLVYSIVNTRERMRNVWKAKFDEEVATLLFGESLGEIMQIIGTLKDSNDAARTDLDEQGKCILDYAIVHASEWLKKRRQRQTEEQVD